MPLEMGVLVWLLSDVCIALYHMLFMGPLSESGLLFIGDQERKICVLTWEGVVDGARGRGCGGDGEGGVERGGHVVVCDGGGGVEGDGCGVGLGVWLRAGCVAGGPRGGEGPAAWLFQVVRRGLF